MNALFRHHFFIRHAEAQIENGDRVAVQVFMVFATRTAGASIRVWSTVNYLITAYVTSDSDFFKIN